MWDVHVAFLRSGSIQKVRLTRGGAPVRYQEVLQWWQSEEAFCAFFSALLSDAPWSAYRWETPPVTAATVDRDFEFVLVDSPALARCPDPDAFARHFDGSEGREVVTFPNLSGDAVLVVPCPSGPDVVYGHLAAFMREGTEVQKHALWRAVGSAVEGRLGERPLWLSTAGLGVPWLHVRVDARPKYYSYGPYRAGADF